MVAGERSVYVHNHEIREDAWTFQVSPPETNLVVKLKLFPTYLETNTARPINEPPLRVTRIARKQSEDPDSVTESDSSSSEEKDSSPSYLLSDEDYQSSAGNITSESELESFAEESEDNRPFIRVCRNFFPNSAFANTLICAIPAVR